MPKVGKHRKWSFGVLGLNQNSNTPMLQYPKVLCVEMMEKLGRQNTEDRIRRTVIGDECTVKRR
jgi:hypothetical protein